MFTPRSLKTVAISALLLLFSLACIPAVMAQTATTPPDPSVTPPLVEFTEVFAAGGSWNQTGSPQFCFTAANAHRITTGVYSFTAVDVFALTNPTPLLPNQAKYTITVTPTTGIATQIRSFGKVRLFGIGTIGAAAGGSQVGWAYSAGGFAYIPLGKGFSVIPNFRTVKTSLSGEFQGILGVMIGWGK